MPRRGRVEARPGEPQVFAWPTVGPQALFQVLNARPSLTAPEMSSELIMCLLYLMVNPRKVGP